MAEPSVEVGPGGARRRREARTVTAMIRMYCRHHHRQPGLCAECQALVAYAGARLQRCPYGDDKPTCVHCPIHCYRAAEREQVRRIMRWAGPRMLWRHPVLAALHLIDQRRGAPASRPGWARRAVSGG